MQGGLYRQTSIGPRQLSDESLRWGQVYPPPGSGHAYPQQGSGHAYPAGGSGHAYPAGGSGHGHTPFSSVRHTAEEDEPDDEYDPTDPGIESVRRVKNSRDQNVYLIVSGSGNGKTDGKTGAGAGAGDAETDMYASHEADMYASNGSDGPVQSPADWSVQDLESKIECLARSSIADKNHIEKLQGTVVEMSRMLIEMKQTVIGLKQAQFGGAQGGWDTGALCQRVEALEQTLVQVKDNQKNLYANQEDVLRRITDWMQGRNRC